MPLRELLQIRPKTPNTLVGRKFAFLFSKHPAVIEIDEHLSDADAIAQAWCDLRVQEVANGMSTYELRRLTASIDRHLADTLKADANTIERVQGAWTNQMHRVQNRKRVERRGRVESTSEVRAYWRRKAKECRKRIENGENLPFEHFIEKHRIDISGLTAAQIERNTRVFYKELKPENTGVLKMGQYLKMIGFDSGDINAAIGLRRNFMGRQRSLLFQRRRRREQLQAKNNESDQTLTAMNEMGVAIEYFMKLVGMSDWWKPDYSI